MQNGAPLHQNIMCHGGGDFTEKFRQSRNFSQVPEAIIEF